VAREKSDCSVGAVFLTFHVRALGAFSPHTTLHIIRELSRSTVIVPACVREGCVLPAQMIAIFFVLPLFAGRTRG
jgi:hypothetical protein